MRRWALGVVLGLVAAGCEKPAAEGLVEHASFGIFFGGQIQERNEIPFTLDRTKQRQGFRIAFRAPLSSEVPIHWELDRPALRGKGRRVVLGDSIARAGQSSFEVELPFQPGDPLGTWNVRVTIADEAAIDRPVLVYDAQARLRAKAAMEQEERADDDE